MMRVALLDVNVLIALFDPAHPNHDGAHRWFGQNRRHGWATCPITLNGCARVLSSPSYPTLEVTPVDVLRHLRAFCNSSDHIFWNTGISLLDETLFASDRFLTHRTITDVYLLALTVRNNGTLVTFDRSIPLRSVVGAERVHLTLLS